MVTLTDGQLILRSQFNFILEYNTMVLCDRTIVRKISSSIIGRFNFYNVKSTLCMAQNCHNKLYEAMRS